MKYLAVTGFRSEQELRAYLYPYARVFDDLSLGTTREGLMWAIVEVPGDRAEYQQGRFHSGFIGCRVESSPYGAALSILERA
jgi:hypothetical protein